MSIARVVTKRIRRSEVPVEPVAALAVLPARSQTVKSPSHVDRSKISLPVALVSTTNMLSYHAPSVNAFRKDVVPLAEEDSDNSGSGRSRASSNSSRHTTLTEASSLAESPPSPKPRHFSGFFPPGKSLRRSASSTNSLEKIKETVVVVEPVPAIPSRALSHSKDAHERLAKKRSMQAMHVRGGSKLRAGAAVGREVHPFDQELKQLNEVAEEFCGVARDAEAQSDLTTMRTKNLAAFCAADYLADIQPLFDHRFGTTQTVAPMAWI